MIEQIPSFRILAAALVLFLSGCGGGDGDSGNDGANDTVPTQATASLASDEASAKSMVSVLVDTDDQAVESESDFENINRLTSNIGLATGSLNPLRAAKQTDQTVSCSQFYPSGETIGDGQVTGCTGTISISSNLDEFQTGNNDTLLPVGAFFRIVFGQVSVQTSNGGSFTLGGSLTMTVLQSSERSDSNGFIGAFRISVANLTGVDSSGETFGPENSTIDVTFSENGGVTFVVDGVRVSDFEVTETADDDSYTINSGTIITAYDGSHAEISFENWVVVDGIPQVGSTVRVTGANGSATVTVEGIVGTTITFRVAITVDGNEETHFVDAAISGNQVVVS